MSLELLLILLYLLLFFIIPLICLCIIIRNNIKRNKEFRETMALLSSSEDLQDAITVFENLDFWTKKYNVDVKYNFRGYFR